MMASNGFQLNHVSESDLSDDIDDTENDAPDSKPTDIVKSYEAASRYDEEKESDTVYIIPSDDSAHCGM